MIPTLGVDPGVKGGLAVLNSSGEPVHITAFKPKWTHAELVSAVVEGYNILQTWRAPNGYTKKTVFVEKVGYMPGDGGKGANTFGRVDGLIRGALIAKGATVRDVPPMCWQMRMGCLTGGNKNVSKARAAELFPRVKMTHSIADALLIARYGWETLCL